MEVESTTTPNTSNNANTAGGGVKQRINNDVGLKRILFSIIGTPQRNFQDGLLFDSTIVALQGLWSKLDYVHQGVLLQKDFESARGIDPIWIQILDACDFNSDGHITPAEFVAGFTMAALDKQVTVSLEALSNPQNTQNLTGLKIISNVVVMLNQQIMDEITIVKTKMSW